MIKILNKEVLLPEPDAMAESNEEELKIKLSRGLKPTDFHNLGRNLQFHREYIKDIETLGNFKTGFLKVINALGESVVRLSKEPNFKKDHFYFDQEKDKYVLVPFDA